MRQAVPYSLTVCLLSAIALSVTAVSAEARPFTTRSTTLPPDALQLRLAQSPARPFKAPSMKPAPGAEPTCYVKMPGRSVQFLDHLCGVNDPQTDRRRSPTELDKDGLPFVMKENYQVVKELQQRLNAAQQRMETEMPFSNNAKQLMAEQKNLINQYSSAKTSADSQALQKRLEEIATKLQADPTVRKAYEMMGKLYQQNR
jgi:hypothetical protein